jgi:hypothetical protein
MIWQISRQAFAGCLAIIRPDYAAPRESGIFPALTWGVVFTAR